MTIPAPKMIWVEMDTDAHFVWLDDISGTKYVRADLYEKALTGYSAMSADKLRLETELEKLREGV